MDGILTNCQAFLEILSMTRSEILRQWDKETFERAYNWAVYFEKVHSKLSKHSSLKKRLDAHLKHIIKSKQLSFGQEIFDFDSLLKSTDILFRSCLANAWLSEQQLTYLLELYSRSGTTVDPYGNFLCHCFSVSHGKVKFSVLHELKDTLQHSIETVKKDSENNQEILNTKCQTSDDVALETSAQRLMNHFQWQLTEAERADRTKQLASRLAFLCTFDRGHELLLHGIICSDTERSEARDFVLGWLIAHADSKLWECHPPLLSQTAFLSVEFFKLYLKFLLDQEYDHKTMDNLKEHWGYLISGPKCVKEICVKALQSAMPLNRFEQDINEAMLHLFYAET